MKKQIKEWSKSRAKKEALVKAFKCVDCGTIYAGKFLAGIVVCGTCHRRKITLAKSKREISQK